MLIQGTTRLLGVLGNPVAHSFSPAMHNAALRKLGLDLLYVPLRINPHGLDALLRAMREMDFLGVNVTIPHKQSIISHLDEVSDLSRQIGAVNTIVGRNGKLFGTTTDPEGFLGGFREAGQNFDGKSVVLLGNGGTARTAAFALFLQAKPKRIALAARNRDKSEVLAAEIRGKLGHELEIFTLDEYSRSRKEFEVVVQTTPVGMHPKMDASLLPAEWLEPGQVVYDLIYNPEETLLMKHARARGCQTVGGLGMLVQQGVASFKLWTGTDPDPADFYAGIREQQEVNRLRDAGTK